MPTEARIVIVGAGGHGKVVADALLCARPDSPLCFADEQVQLHQQLILGCPVLGPASAVLQAGDCFHVAIGHNGFRAKAFTALSAGAARALSIIHPAARISPFAVFGQGVFLAAGCVLAPSAKIGDAVIVNHGAIVDHDCSVGSFSHLAPASSLSGGVVLGQGVFVGTGARVLPGIRVGDHATIGAGAVVTRDVAPGALVVGVPARSVSRTRDA